jgi:hypothetical protein
MQLTWLSIGLLAGLSAWILHEFKKLVYTYWKANEPIAVIFLVLFGISRSESSILEGVLRSGSMGTGL